MTIRVGSFSKVAFFFETGITFISVKSFSFKNQIFLRVLLVSFVKVVKKCLKRWKSLLRALDKSSSFDRLLAINNISRIKLNGYDDANRLTTP